MKNLLYSLLTVFLLFSCNNIKTERVFYASGELKEKYQTKNGRLHGDYYEYYKTGVIKEEAKYFDGKLNGIRRVFYENGNLNWEAQYKDDKNNGFHKEYSKSGKLIIEAYFNNDKQDSICRWFYPDGTLEKEVEFKNGIEHGYSKFYYPNGKIELDTYFVNGGTKYFKKYSENNNLLEEYRYCEIKPKIDTLNAGENFIAKIKIYGPINEKNKLNVKISETKIKSLFDSGEITISNHGEATYKQKLQKSGHFYFNVQFFLANEINQYNTYYSEIVVLDNVNGNPSKKLVE
ncbi:MAG: toxin-antitoxin system YwqK family antitoxin [Kiritimatiellae bacterium]|nr:toxin-antitoxin system YwqK family antitoxin [Kiritimatiellia bacterium]